MKKWRVILIWVCACAGELCARQNSYFSNAALDELRLELSDVKHELHSARVEIQLLEEKIAKQERNLAASKSPGTQAALASHESKFDALEKKLDRLEKTLEKALIDVRTINANETKAIAKIQELESSLASQEKKIDEIGKLKNTLTTISKAIGQSVKTAQQAAAQTYKVKAGDSLEKIARAHNITVEEIKQLNQLSQDKIIIGQELKMQ